MKSFLHGFNATVPENKSSRILHFSVAEECSSENDGFSDYHGVPENVLVSDRLLPNHLCSKNAINNYFTRSFHYSGISFLCFFKNFFDFIDILYPTLLLTFPSTTAYIAFHYASLYYTGSPKINKTYNVLTSIWQ